MHLCETIQLSCRFLRFNDMNDTDLRGTEWFWAIVGIAFLPIGLYLLWSIVTATPWESEGSTIARQELVNGGVSTEVVESVEDCLTRMNEISDRPRLERDTIPLDCPAYPVAVGERWSGKIVVGEIYTLNGKWSGSEPRVTLDELGSISRPRTHTDTWGSLTNPSWGWEEVWIDANLPPPSAEMLHQQFSGLADLQLTVPESAGASSFVNVQTTRDRSFTLYVVSSNELDLLAQTLARNPLLVLAFGALGLLFTIMGGAALFTVTRQIVKEIQLRLS